MRIIFGNLSAARARLLRAAAALALLMVGAACTETTNYARDGRAINLRDCSEWSTDSIPGCYDGQGGRN